MKNPHIHIKVHLFQLINTLIEEGKKPKRITDKTRPQKESK